MGEVDDSATVERTARPVIRLALEAWHADHGRWVLPYEIDLSADHDSRYAGWLVDVPQA